MTANEENPFVGAYWFARRETRHECAVRIALFLEGIAEQPPFGCWYLTRKSRKTALVPLEVSVADVERQLKTNNRDIDGSAIEELGFSLSVWNGNDYEPASFAVTCGAWSNYVKNSAVLSLPPQTAPTDTITGKPLRTLLEKSVRVWDPDYAVVTTIESMARKGGAMPWDVGGWFAYERGGKIIVAYDDNRCR